MNKKLLIIDGHNFLFRAFSVPFKFHSDKGTPLHTTTTFIAILRKALSIDNFTEVVVVFDSEHRTTNHEISVDYKANRIYDFGEDESPFEHLPYIKQSLKFLKIKFYEKKGIEADDIIASISNKYKTDNPKSKIVIASTDSDFFQLLSKNISLLRNGELFTEKDLMNKYNIKPKQYVLFKSLTGDKADNIKGVDGVGKVRAEKIVNKKMDFDSKEYKALLEINKKLITLNTEIFVYKNEKSISLNRKIFDLKNPEIFKALNF